MPTLPGLILTPRLVLIPTPIASKDRKYRTLFSCLHSNAEFCNMGFGPNFPVRERDDDETRAWIQEEVVANWDALNLGDFAIALRAEGGAVREIPQHARKLRDGSGGIEIGILEGGGGGDHVGYVGYVGVRDPTRRLPPRVPGDKALPQWQSLVELRYGLNASDWGKGYGTEAARALMLWAEKERGVTRFIAETERANVASKKILRKLGFMELDGNEYWKDQDEIEWERIVRVKV